MNRLNLGAGLLSTILLIIIWDLAAIYINSTFIFPHPGQIFIDFFALMADSEFIKNLVSTFLRGITAFSISLLISLILGIASGLSPVVTSMIAPWMMLIKSTPVVSFILIALLWFGSSFVPVFVSILMTLPVMTEAITQGVRSTDHKLLEMSYVYKFSSFKRLTSIRIPSAMPFLLGGSGASLGLTWKVVVAGEILSSPRFGLGGALQTAKVQLETVRVFSLTLTAILLSVTTDILFHSLVKRSRTTVVEKTALNEN